MKKNSKIGTLIVTFFSTFIIGINAEPPLKKITIEEHPVDQVVKYGQSVHFSVKASLKGEQGPIEYQWMRNFSRIEGATKPTLSLGKVSTSDLGVYGCIVSTQHDKEYDQPEAKASELVSLMAYNLVGNKVVIDAFLLPMCEANPEIPARKVPAQKARNGPVYPMSDTLMYAANRRATPWYAVDKAPLYFISFGTNQFTVDYWPPAGGSGAGSGTCPPPYKCYFNFRKGVAPYGWALTNSMGGTARHLQSPTTVIKWFVGTQRSGCGTGGIVNVPFVNTTDIHRFTVYCPSATFQTCLSGVQQLELTGFAP